MSRAARINGFATFSACGIYRYELGGDIIHGFMARRRKRLDQQAAAHPTLFPDAADAVVVDAGVRPRTLVAIMLNPSKADAQDTDPTITRVVTYAFDWGFKRLIVGNANAYCATDPDDMWAADRQGIDIVGPGNDSRLRRMMESVRGTDDRIMVGWGVECQAHRAQAVAKIARDVGINLYCLATNKDGSPVHPLYQRASLTLRPWAGTGA